MDEQKLEEIRYKLKSKSVIVKTEAVELIARAVGKCIAGGSKGSGGLEQYIQLLKDVCASEDPVASVTGCHGFLSLLDEGFLDSTRALSLLNAIVVTVKKYTGIASLASRTLIMTVNESFDTSKSYKSDWQIAYPTHPMILILQTHPDSIGNIYDEINFICSPSSGIYEHSLELLRPVFIWILCNPKSQNQLTYKLKTLKLLLTMTDAPDQRSLLLECMGHQKMPGQHNDVCELYSLIAERSMDAHDIDICCVTLPLLVTTLYEIILNGDNPSQCIEVMSKLIGQIEKFFNDKEISENYFNLIINCTLGLAVDSINVCPILYMMQLLTFCEKLCLISNCKIFLNMLKFQLLQWEYNKNNLTKCCHDKIRELLLKILNSNDDLDVAHPIPSDECKLFDYFKSINRRIYIVHRLYSLYACMKENENAFTIWMTNLKSLSNVDLQSEYFAFLEALLITNIKCVDAHIKIDTVNVLMDICKTKPELMVSHLPMLLHCLRLSNSPEETLLFLYSIPEMATIKENIPLVVNILKLLETSKRIPMPLLINMNMRLVEKQNRCFAFLQIILAKSSVQSVDKKWEVLTAKACALKYICETRAVNYGVEIVPILSDILSQCTTEESSTACCLSLKAIEALWKAEIIDPISTWQVLAPKFVAEKRELVNISICNLLAIVPKLYYESPEYDDFITVTMRKLWKYVINFDSKAINTAALEAISNFGLKHTTMRHFPDVYKEGIKLPSSFSKLQSDTMQTVDDMTYIPSTLWGNLFKYSKPNCLLGINKLCHTLIVQEIESYHSGIYNIVNLEPDNVKYLPVASVVGGLLEFIRRDIPKITPDSVDAISECIKCLSLPLKKPLPPLNWTFLAPVLREKNELYESIKFDVFKILLRQTEVSPSAVKIINSFIEAIKNSDDTSSKRILFELLSDVSNHVKSPLYMPIVDNCLELSFSMISNQSASSETFAFYCESIGKCLAGSDCRQDVRQELSKIISKFHNVICHDSPVWNAYADVCCKIETDSINVVLKLNGAISNHIRFRLALESDAEKCLLLLDEIIDYGFRFESNQDSLMEKVVAILKRHIKSEILLQSWILKLLSEISNQGTREATSSAKEVFLCDIFLVSILIISQHYVHIHESAIFYTNQWKSLPMALNSLFFNASNGVMNTLGSQIIEWGKNNINNKRLPKEVIEAFQLSIISYCNSVVSKDSDIWGKYITSRSYLIN